MAMHWKATGEEKPPIKERLPLIFSAGGDPPNKQLMDFRELGLGYWTGDHFQAFQPEFPYNIAVRPTHWATLDLPRGVILQPRSEFR
jgi:hypothetical protein